MSDKDAEKKAIECLAESVAEKFIQLLDGQRPIRQAKRQYVKLEKLARS